MPHYFAIVPRMLWGFLLCFLLSTTAKAITVTNTSDSVRDHCDRRLSMPITTVE